MQSGVESMCRFSTCSTVLHVEWRREHVKIVYTCYDSSCRLAQKTYVDFLHRLWLYMQSMCRFSTHATVLHVQWRREHVQIFYTCYGSTCIVAQRGCVHFLHMLRFYMQSGVESILCILALDCSTGSFKVVISSFVLLDLRKILI